MRPVRWLIIGYSGGQEVGRIEIAGSISQWKEPLYLGGIPSDVADKLWNDYVRLDWDARANVWRPTSYSETAYDLWRASVAGTAEARAEEERERLDHDNMLSSYLRD